MQKQESEKRYWKIIYNCLGVFYAACLVYIFFFARRRWRIFPERIVNVIPFRDKIHYLQTHSIRVRPENLEFYKDLAGNILVFVPFPLLLFHFFKISSLRTLLLISVATSFCVETLQYIFNIGVADIDDLILNTTGACIGLLLLIPLLRMKATNQYG